MSYLPVNRPKSFLFSPSSGSHATAKKNIQTDVADTRLLSAMLCDREVGHCGFAEVILGRFRCSRIACNVRCGYREQILVLDVLLLAEGIVGLFSFCLGFVTSKCFVWTRHHSA